MLTKGDVSQIRKVVREEVEAEVGNAKEELDSEIRTSRVRVQTDIYTLGNKIKNVEIRTMNLEKSNQQILNNIKILRKDIKGTINIADHGLLKLEKRVGTIEEHLNIPEPQIA